MDRSSDDYQTLVRQADVLRDSGLYEDALRLYQRALRTEGGSDGDRLWTRYWVGSCLRMLGRYAEAFSWYGELFLETRNLPAMHEIAFRSLYGQFEALQCVQRSENIETNDNLNKRLAMIEEGLQWLRDIGRETWRPALLYLRAATLQSLGELEEALAAAEEAYRIDQEFNPPGFASGVYPRSVASIARSLGRHNRAIELLDEMNGRATDPLDKIGIEIERVRTLNQMGPGRASEALATARQLVRLADQIQSDYDRFLAYAELAETALAANSLEEARDALHVVRELALMNETGNRGTMLRDARRVFKLLKDSFPDLLPAWEAEIDQAIEAMQPKRA